MGAYVMHRRWLMLGLLTSCIFPVLGAAPAQPADGGTSTTIQVSPANPNDIALLITQARYQARLRYAHQLLSEAGLPESDPARQLTIQAEDLSGTDPRQAIESLHQALQQMDAFARRDPTRQRLQARYLALLDGLQNFDTAFQRNASRAAADKAQPAPADYDRKQIADKLAEAEQLAGQGQIMQGVRVLTVAENLIAQSIRGILNHRSRGEGTVFVETEQEQAANAQVRHAQETREYEARRAALQRFKEAHHRNVERLRKDEGAQAVVPYDAELVAWLEKEAQASADRGNYREAAQVLKGSVDLVAAPLQRMLDKHKYVVKLDISTPEKEYRHEQNRYLGYEELIPVGIRRLAPEPALLDKVNALADKGRWMAAESEKKAAAQDYPVAIRMLQDATAKIQTALRLLGVPVLTGAEATGAE